MSQSRIEHEKQLYCAAFSHIQASDDFAERVKTCVKKQGGKSQIQRVIGRRHLVQAAAVALVVVVLLGVGQIPSVQASIHDIYEAFYRKVVPVYEENVKAYAQDIEKTISVGNGKTITFQDCALTSRGLELRYAASDSSVGIMNVTLSGDDGERIEFFSSAHLDLSPTEEKSDKIEYIGSFYCDDSVDINQCLNASWLLQAEVYMDRGEELETREVPVANLTFDSLYEIKELLEDAQEVTTQNGTYRVTGVAQNSYFTEISYECSDVEAGIYTLEVYDESGNEYCFLGGSSYEEQGVEIGSWDVEQIPEETKQLEIVPSLTTDDEKEQLGKIVVDLD